MARILALVGLDDSLDGQTGHACVAGNGLEARITARRRQDHLVVVVPVGVKCRVVRQRLTFRVLSLSTSFSTLNS